MAHLRFVAREEGRGLIAQHLVCGADTAACMLSLLGVPSRAAAPDLSPLLRAAVATCRQLWECEEAACCTGVCRRRRSSPASCPPVNVTCPPQLFEASRHPFFRTPGRSSHWKFCLLPDLRHHCKAKSNLPSTPAPTNLPTASCPPFDRGSPSTSAVKCSPPYAGSGCPPVPPAAHLCRLLPRLREALSRGGPQRRAAAGKACWWLLPCLGETLRNMTASS